MAHESGNLSRRAFVTGLAPGGSGPVSQSSVSLAFRDNRTVGKTLVVIFLRGAADTLSLLVPYGDDDYYRLRPTISIAPPSKPGGALKLDGFYGLHPKLAPLMRAYREGRLAFIQGAGSDNPTGSHFDAQDQMEHGESYGEAMPGGWLGRYLASIGEVEAPFGAVAISATLPESLRGARGACAIESVDDLAIAAPNNSTGAIKAALASMYGESELLAAPARETLRLLQQVEDFRRDGYRSAPGVDYPGNDFGRGLREIARVIKARVGLKVAAIDLIGWDTHFFQGSQTGQQADLIDTLGRGFAAFDVDLADIRDEVITVTMTEFGRRSYENTSLGTDHGRGFAMVVLGGGIAGGRVIGPWPGLKEEEPWPGPGGLKINIDYRGVLAEVIEAAGAHKAAAVFPGAPRPQLSLWAV